MIIDRVWGGEGATVPTLAEFRDRYARPAEMPQDGQEAPAGSNGPSWVAEGLRLALKPAWRGILTGPKKLDRAG